MPQRTNRNIITAVLFFHLFFNIFHDLDHILYHVELGPGVYPSWLCVLFSILVMVTFFSILGMGMVFSGSNLILYHSARQLSTTKTKRNLLIYQISTVLFTALCVGLLLTQHAPHISFDTGYCLYVPAWWKLGCYFALLVGTFVSSATSSTWLSKRRSLELRSSISSLVSHISLSILYSSFS